MADEFQLRVYCYLDRTQPQYAAFVGTVTQGDLMVEGMASLYIEVAPGNEAEKRANIKLIHISSVGRVGRMWMCGTESEMVTAKMAAIAAIEGIQGRKG